MEPIVIDGKTGEGGGQVVRIAVGLSALTSKPIKITNIRANRPRPGLKTQHFTAIQWLADVTDAQVDGLRVGSKTLTFIPRRPPADLAQRNIKISPRSNSAASTLLVLQTILPFLLFASDDDNTPINLTIYGGTNTSYAPSFEYIDHVLLPTLEERLGIKVGRSRTKRGWSIGPPLMGCVHLVVHPLPKNETLVFKPDTRPRRAGRVEIRQIELVMIVTPEWEARIEGEIRKHLSLVYPDAEFIVKPQVSRRMRWHVLLVAQAFDGRRWGKDVLCSLPKKESEMRGFISETFKMLCQQLEEEVGLGGEVDDHLQDQVVCFQALCSGLSSFPRHDEPKDARPPGDILASAMNDLTLDSEGLTEDDARRPFGHGSLHTQTARWVVKQILPEVKFYNGGDVVQGSGIKVSGLE